METIWQSGQGQEQRQPSGRVYCYGEPHLWLDDGTPLYLEWLLEGDDLALYKVPAEPGGWLKRRNYHGARSSLKPVPVVGAWTIVSLLRDRSEQAEKERPGCLTDEPVTRTLEAPSRATAKFGAYSPSGPGGVRNFVR